MVGHVNDKGITEIGVGLISVGWMGKLHSRAFQAIPLVYPELNIRPRLVHAADTAADRVEYAVGDPGLHGAHQYAGITRILHCDFADHQRYGFHLNVGIQQGKDAGVPFHLVANERGQCLPAGQFDRALPEA